MFDYEFSREQPSLSPWAKVLEDETFLFSSGKYPLVRSQDFQNYWLHNLKEDILFCVQQAAKLGLEPNDSIKHQFILDG
jgi:hypothetical protein